MKSALRTLCVALFLSAFAPPTHAQAVQLAVDGKARMQVVVAEHANESTRQAAARLADYLGRISGGEFAVAPGDGSKGIAVGLASDFPAVKTGTAWETGDAAQREA